MVDKQRVLLVQGRGYERLETMLNQDGLEVSCAQNGKQAVSLAKGLDPVLAVIDPHSLRIGGIRLCQMLHRAVESIMIIWVLAEDEEFIQDTLVNDHVRRPITSTKLIQSVRTLLPKPQDHVLEVGELKFYVQERRLVKGQQVRRLTPKQGALLQALMLHAGEVLSRRYLMKHVWNTDYLGDTRTLDVHVRWVREAIENDPSKPQYLRTVRGVGYRLDVPQTACKKE